MSYFARRIDYAAHDGEAGAHFLALIELAKKKSGQPVGFVLYRYIVQYNHDQRYPNGLPYEITMIRLRTTDREEAKKFFPHEEKNKFPGHRSILWRPTTKWLYAVAVGGGHEQFPEGTWVKVGKPALWKVRRKKKALRFGDNHNLIKREEEKINSIRREINGLRWEQNGLELYDSDDDSNYVPEECTLAYEEIEKDISLLKEEMEVARIRIICFKDELRFVFARKSGKPYYRRDFETWSLIAV